jgi:putative inorganic carbon (HCO3(-)) transporter
LLALEGKYKFSDAYLWLLKCCVLLLPLIAIPSLNAPFVTAKYALLLFFGIVLVFLLSTETFLKTSLEWPKAFFNLPLSLFLAIILISSLFSLDGTDAIFGEYMRFEGLLSWFTYLLLYLVAFRFLRTQSKALSILKLWLASASLVAVVAILQYFGLDIFSEFKGTFEGRSYATFGNPVILANYLVLTFPLALTCLWRAENFFLRITYAACTLLLLLAVMASYSRAGWLGFFFGFVTFLFGVGWLGGLSWRRLLALTGSVILVLFLLYLVISITDTPLALRLSNTFQLKSGTTATRIEIWKSTLHLINERPLVGYGLDNFRSIFPRYQSLRLIRLEPGTTDDRPHNDLLQMASSMGLLGLLAYLWFIISFLSKSLLLLKKHKNVLLIGLLSAFGAYMLSIQFSFGSLGDRTLFFILIAILSRASLENFATYQLPLRWGFREQKLAIAGVAFVGILLTFFLLRNTAADYHFKKGLLLQRAKQFDEAIKEFSQAKELNGHEGVYSLYLATSYFQKASMLADAQRLLLLDQAARCYQEVSRLEPYAWEAYEGLAKVYTLRRQPEVAVRFGERAISYNPYALNARLQLGLAYALLGDLKRATSNIKFVLALDPANELARRILTEAVLEKNHPKSD